MERKVRTLWSGNYEEKEPIYQFPNDVYLKDGGFDLTRYTGRGEQAIRNAVMLHALVRRYEIANDEIAIDLAGGIANYLLGPSHYFNYKMEFFGHVHSAGWVASGLARLGRVTRNERYAKAGKGVIEGNLAVFRNVAAGRKVELEHSIETAVVKEEEIVYDNPLQPVRVLHEFRNEKVTGKWHYHNELELIAVVRGEFSIYTKDRIFRLTAGDVAIIGSFEPHHSFKDEGIMEYIVLQFDIFKYIGQNLISYMKYFTEAGRLYSKLNYIFTESPEVKRRIFDHINEISREYARREKGYKFP